MSGEHDEVMQAIFEDRGAKGPIPLANAPINSVLRESYRGRHRRQLR